MTNNDTQPQFRSIDTKTNKSTASRYTGGRFTAKNTKTRSLNNTKSNAYRITHLLKELGAIGQNGLPARVIMAKLNEKFVTNKTINAVLLALSKLAAKKLVYARPSDTNKNITLYSLPDGDDFYKAYKTKPASFAGGSQDSVNSKTPSLKMPNSRYNRLIAIVREKPGLSTNQVVDEYNYRHNTNFDAGDLQLSRLAAKGIIRGEPSARDARVTLWYIK